MKVLSNIRILKGFFSFFSVVFSYLSWWSIQEAVHNPYASDLLAPFLFISLTFVFLGVLFVIVKEKKSLIGLVTVVLLQSAWFAPTVWHIGLLVVALMLTVGGMLRIQSELQERLKIHIIYSLRRGFSPIILAFSLVLCSVYFVQISSLPTESLVPNIQFGKRTENFVYRFLGNISPQLQPLQKRELTVDDFIASLTEKQIEQQAQGVQNDLVDEILQRRGLLDTQRQEIDQVIEIHADAAIEIEKERALESGRKQLSELAGIPLRGSERITDIFTLIVNNKVRAFTSEQVRSQVGVAAVPLAITALLFITIMPIASVVKYVWFMFSGAIVRMCMRFGWIKVHKISKISEVLE